MVSERVAALRRRMKEAGVDAYYIPTDDFHGSEYVGSYFKCREYISGFTGSAGTAVVLADEAGLWTDARYFLQAEEQLKGSGITLYRMREEGVPSIEEFLAGKLQSGQTLGMDGRTVSARTALELERQLDGQGVSLSYELDLVGDIWTERPELSHEPVWQLETKWTGETREERIARIRRGMEEKKADVFVLTALDDLAWLLNLRGNDVACNPVFLSYGMIRQDSFDLYIQEEAVSAEVRRALEQAGVSLCPYNGIYPALKKIGEGERVLLDEAKVNYAVYRDIPAGAVVLNEQNLTQLPKAMKTPTEVKNLFEAHRKDGVAVTKYMYWLKKNVGRIPITELSAGERLERLREEQENYLGPSFDQINAYDAHGAIMHYSATKETDVPIEAKSFLLSDTGGQYMEGTTDITRTFALGVLTHEQKLNYTSVLRGNLNLAAAKFLHGCHGWNLDYLARGPLWERGLDFKHGTGHGVGYLLNVHEGPQGIRWHQLKDKNEDAALEEGMVTSNEPGYYEDGNYGIRLENMMVCRKAEKNEYGQFMEFDTLTVVPFDLDAVLPEEMTAREKALLNAYHKRVYETLAPDMTPEEAEWLKNATREV